MYPVLFRIGSFEITSFGVMVAVGSLVGYWLFSRELRRSGLPASASDAALYGILGGLLGAKLLWVAEHAREEPFFSLVVLAWGHELVWRDSRVVWLRASASCSNAGYRSYAFWQR